MTLRDKTMKLLDLTMVPFDKNIEGLVSQFEQQFKGGFGELPPEAAEALTAISAALRAGRDSIEGRVAALHEEQFTEADLDALIAHHETELGQKLHRVSPLLMEKIALETNAWVNEIMKGVEPELTRLLGVSTAPFVPTPSLIEPPTTPPAPSAA